MISDNRLTSELPRSLCNQTALRHFSASNNRFSGRVPPCRFPNVEVFDVASNRLTGTLPRVGSWEQLSYLLLHDNSFTGGVASLALNGSVLSAGKQPDPYTDDYYDTEQSYLGGNLVGLTLHQNRLDEALPEDLALPPSLEYFTVSNNLIPGRVPRRLLSLLNSSRGHAAWEPSGFMSGADDDYWDDDYTGWTITSGYVHVAGNRTTVLLSNNRLSCSLRGYGDLALAQSSLVLVGNLFSAAIPHWVPKAERDSTFLQTVTRVLWESWDDFTLPPWLDILLQFAGVAVVTALGLWWMSSSSPLSSSLWASSSS